jgi:hypothetical protein
MVEYINERYEDDTFTFYQRYNWDNHSILVTSEKFPNEYIRIAHITSDGRDYFNDNYLYFKFREQATVAITEMLEEVLGHEFKLFYDNNAPYVGTDLLPADILFDDYMSNSASRLRFRAVVAPGYDASNQDTVTKRFKTVIDLLNIAIANSVVHFCIDIEVYESLNVENLNHFVAVIDREPKLRLSSIGTAHEEFIWMESYRR